MKTIGKIYILFSSLDANRYRFITITGTRQLSYLYFYFISMSKHCKQTEIFFYGLTRLPTNQFRQRWQSDVLAASLVLGAMDYNIDIFAMITEAKRAKRRKKRRGAKREESEHCMHVNLGDEMGFV